MEEKCEEAELHCSHKGYTREETRVEITANLQGKFLHLVTYCIYCGKIIGDVRIN